MGYNTNCQYQNCSYGCCNYKGDCPEWYSNGNTQYTNCYYYYGVDPTTLLATGIGTAIGVVIIIIIACAFYRNHRKRQLELLK